MFTLSSVSPSLHRHLHHSAIPQVINIITKPIFGRQSKLLLYRCFILEDFINGQTFFFKKTSVNKFNQLDEDQ